MTGLRSTLLRLVPASLVGGILGALLLLVLPESAFETIVPVLIGLALVLVVTGPRLNRWASRRRGVGGRDDAVDGMGSARWVALILGVFAGGVYGGYFGAAQGVLLVGLMGVLLPLRLQQINGMKNVLTMLVNLVAALVFLLVQPEQINWAVVALIAVGSTVGGVIGAKVGRSMPPWLLRGVIVTIGVIAIWVLLT